MLNEKISIRIVVEVLDGCKIIDYLHFNNHYMVYNGDFIEYSCEIRDFILNLCDYYKTHKKLKYNPCEDKK